MSYSDVMKNIYVDQKRLINKWYDFLNQYLKKRKTLAVFNLINSYVNSIENDLPSPVTAEDGRKTINLLESIKESLINEKPVKLAY